MKRWLPILLGVLSISAGSAELAVRLKARAIRRHQEVEMLHALETGALQPMLRARALGQRLALAYSDDARIQLRLALVEAMLARLFEVGTDADAEQQVRRAARLTKPDAEPLFGTVEALLALGRGQVDTARDQAMRATQLEPGGPFPLIALAMADARSGALAAASKVLEAVMVREPQLVLARVAWAEVRIDLGDVETAAVELESVLKKVPGHTRAALLLSEARTIIATEGAGKHDAVSKDRSGVGVQPRARVSLQDHCERDGHISPAMSASCALDEAGLARLDGRRELASRRALAVAASATSEPRILARAAQLLALLGEIDVAAKLVDRAAAASGADLQALTWARAAITLGRGGVAVIPPTASITGPDSRVIAARAAFASGGTAGLVRFLAGIEPTTVAADPDLARVAQLVQVDGSSAAPAHDSAADAGAGPVEAYVAGMRARLSKNNRAAVEWLSRSLEGHGDACRAAGEYLDALRALRLERPPESVFASLRATNRSCVNLPGVHSAPPVQEHIRAPIRR